MRRDEIVTGGKIDLSYAYSPALIPELSHLTVLLNGEVLGSMPLPKETNSGATASLNINPVLFQQDNRVLFRFIGHYTLGCEDPLHSSLWLVLSNTSKLTMQLEKLPLANDLSLLPAKRRSTDPKRHVQAADPARFVFCGSSVEQHAAGRRARWRRGSARSPSYPQGRELPDLSRLGSEYQRGRVRDPVGEAGRRRHSGDQRADDLGRSPTRTIPRRSCSWSWVARPRR